VPFLPDPLHPAVVHFPIALTFVALLLEAASRVPRWRSLEGGSLVLIVLAALGALAGMVTGTLAHDEAVVPVEARALLEQHEELGVLLGWGVPLLAVARVLLARFDRRYGPLGWLYLVLLCVVCGAMAYQGHLGGRLVYDHGVGTALLPVAPASVGGPTSSP
jgi:uncharacterized membrane protein